jgi:hypothetical protein
MVRVIARKEFLAGLLFAAIGTGALVMALGYRIGTPTEMGPGFVPMLLSLLLIGLGLAAAVRAVRLADAPTIGRFPAGPAALVLGGVVAFGVLLPLAGLAPATVALVLLACLGRMRRAPVEAVVLALVLAAVAAGLFVYGLGMPFQVFT